MRPPAVRTSTRNGTRFCGTHLAWGVLFAGEEAKACLGKVDRYGYMNSPGEYNAIGAHTVIDTSAELMQR